MEDQVSIETAPETIFEAIAEEQETNKPKTKVVKTVVKKAKANKPHSSKKLTAVGNGWTFPVGLSRNKWYLAMYFADPTPYTVKFDGYNFKDCYGKLIPVPVRVKPVDVFVPPKEEQ